MWASLFRRANLTLGNGHLNLDSRLDGDGSLLKIKEKKPHTNTTGYHKRYNLLHNISGAVEIDEALVNAHLKAVPGLATLTTGGLSGSDLQVLGGETNGSLNSQFVVLGTLDEIGAYYFFLISACYEYKYTPFSKFLTLRLVRVILMRWNACSSSNPAFLVGKDIVQLLSN